MCVLLVLGVGFEAARACVRKADASPEAVRQDDLLRWAAARAARAS